MSLLALSGVRRLFLQVSFESGRPRVQFESQKSYVESGTDDIDSLAMRRFAMVMIPLLIGYGRRASL